MATCMRSACLVYVRTTKNAAEVHVSYVKKQLACASL